MQRYIVVLALVVMGPSLAWAQAGRGGRPTGFMLETEIGLSSPPILRKPGDYGYVIHAPYARQRLVIGGQLRSVGIGALIGLGVAGLNFENSDDPSPMWSLNFGPVVDFEVLSRGAGGLFLAFALPVYIDMPSSDQSGVGFGFDFGVGGRVFVLGQLALSVKLGSLLHMIWFDNEGGGNVEGLCAGWTIYGAIGVRFVAG